MPSFCGGSHDRTGAIEPSSHRGYARDALWERTHEFERLVKARLTAPDAPLPARLSDGQLLSVEAEVAAKTWGGNFTRGEYRTAVEKAWTATARWIEAPRSNKPTEDLVQAWLQPEGRDLWRRIIESVECQRRTVPAVQFARGTMLATAGLRSTPHVLHGWEALRHNRELSALVGELADSCVGRNKQTPCETTYPNVTRLLPRISRELTAEVHVTLAAIAEQYAALDIPVGRFLAVDGQLTPAWTPQTSMVVEDPVEWGQHPANRRQTPDVGTRIYQRRSYDGHVVTTRRVRGYHLTAAVDLATGLVMAFDLSNAQKSHEPKILRDILLPAMFGLSPRLNVQAIVGDGLFDNNETHEHLETRYGIHLVAARPREKLGSRGKLFKTDEHRSIAAIRGDGVAICRAHGALLDYRGLDAPKRNGLDPGELVDPRSFRSRFICTDGCGKPSISTSECWSHLPYYPHTPHGRLELYAYRHALLRRRNQAESLFSALQIGYKQGTDGAARVRVTDDDSVRALIALSIVTRALLALYAEREIRSTTSARAA